MNSARRSNLFCLVIILQIFVCHCCSSDGISQDETAKAAPLIINNVSIVDVKSGENKSNMRMVILDGKIESIDVESDQANPENAKVIDGTGKFAIPGLWDMHIHWYEKSSMSLFPINGVTGVRVMWGSLYHHQWESKFDAGDSLGPRMFIAGPIIDGPNPIWPGSLVVDSDESAKKAIQTNLKVKADFAKVYSLLSRDAYFALVKECDDAGLSFAGHVPRMVSATEASEAGQRSMEHLYEILLDCSSEEDDLRKMLSDHVEKNQGNVRSLFNESALLKEVSRRALNSFDEEKAQAVFKVFSENETYQCPTLTVLRNMAYLTTPEIQENTNLKYLSPFVRNSIAPRKSRYAESEEQVEFNRKQLKFQQHLLPMMKEAGVPILAGTDVLNPFCLPGFSLHDELQLLVDAGLEPIDALRAATLTPAKFMGCEDELGSLEAGKLADLVLLDANPLKEIKNTRGIHCVITRGNCYPREDLDEMLAAFEAKYRAKEKTDDKTDD